MVTIKTPESNKVMRSPKKGWIVFVTEVIVFLEEGDRGFVLDPTVTQSRFFLKHEALVVVLVNQRVIGLCAMRLVLDF